jgi:hypothetical protein
MSIIPLDLQRRCEQRWAARFARPVPPAAPQRHRLDGESHQLVAPAKTNRETRWVEAAGFKSAPAV